MNENDEYYNSMLTHRFSKIMRQATNVMQILKLANLQEWHNGEHNYTIMYLTQMDKIGTRIEKAMDIFEHEIVEADKEIDALFFKDKALYEMGVDTHLWYLERNYQKNPQSFTTLERWLFHWWKWLRKDRIDREMNINEQNKNK